MNSPVPRPPIRHSPSRVDQLMMLHPTRGREFAEDFRSRRQVLRLRPMPDTATKVASIVWLVTWLLTFGKSGKPLFEWVYLHPRSSGPATSNRSYNPMQNGYVPTASSSKLPKAPKGGTGETSAEPTCTRCGYPWPEELLCGDGTCPECWDAVDLR